MRRLDLIGTGLRVAVASGALALGAVLSSGTAMAQVMGGTAVFVQGSNPPSLDAMVTSSQASRNINMNVYETLYGFSDAIQPIPILAEGVEISADGLTYVFTLRQGVKFHNGKEMTARDVKASLERYRKVGATANLLAPVREIEITGDHEVTFHMVTATPTFLEAFASPRAPAVIIPEEDAEAEAGKTSLIGTGPYRIVEYVPDSHVTIEKFADYSQDTRQEGPDGFGGRKTAYLDTVTFRIIPEPGAQVAALEAGEVHILEQIPVPAARRLESNPDIVLEENMPWAFSVFIMNLNVPPTDNVKFREAVQVALNMEEIMAIASEGIFQLNHGWQYPGTTYDAGDIGAQYYNLADADRAKALLAEAGYGGEEFVILTDSNIPQHNKAAVVIAEQLKAVGINATINMVDWPTALNLRLQDTGWNGWTLQMGIEPYLGPVGVVATLTSPARPHFVVPDAALDALYQELISGPTVADRQEAMRKIQTRLYEIFGIVKLGDSGLMTARRANVKGYVPFRFPRVHDIWLEN
ncbi:MAG: ABC transporter substrate-binding protein [Rhodobacteraceae bacterium]|nr:ABC transporter substrate-binding protein [Paracoccaceae bacterium]